MAVLETLIVRTYALWSVFWIVMLVVEWVRLRRANRLLAYLGTWFLGGVVLVAARVILL